MKSKATRYLLGIGVALLIIFGITAIVVATSNPNLLAVDQPLPPTPGPVPTSLPNTTSEGDSIADRDEVIHRVLYFDSLGTVRDSPLTKDVIAQNPDMIVIESYTTRQEASDVYWGDRFGDPEIASEPVWVVTIKGKVSVEVIGGLPSTQDYVEADGVTYVISQADGKLLRVVAGIPQKRSETSP